MKKDLEVKDIVNPFEIGQRDFDPKEIAKFIRGHRISWCWGGEGWIGHETCFLRFKSNGYLHRGFVYITLGWNDTFTVTLTTLKNKVKSITKDVYIDSLVDVIDGLIEKK